MFDSSSSLSGLYLKRAQHDLVHVRSCLRSACFPFRLSFCKSQDGYGCIGLSGGHIISGCPPITDFRPGDQRVLVHTHRRSSDSPFLNVSFRSGTSPSPLRARYARASRYTFADGRKGRIRRRCSPYGSMCFLGSAYSLSV